MVAQARRYEVETLQAVRVESLEPKDDRIVVRTSTGQVIEAGAVLVATGSTYRRLGVDGEDDLIGAGVHFCATCDGPFYKGKRVAVIGTGASGVQAMPEIAREAHHLTVFQRTANYSVPARNHVLSEARRAVTRTGRVQEAVVGRLRVADGEHLEAGERSALAARRAASAWRGRPSRGCSTC